MTQVGLLLSGPSSNWEFTSSRDLFTSLNSWLPSILERGISCRSNWACRAACGFERDCRVERGVKRGLGEEGTWHICWSNLTSFQVSDITSSWPPWLTVDLPSTVFVRVNYSADSLRTLYFHALVRCAWLTASTLPYLDSDCVYIWVSDKQEAFLPTITAVKL